MTNDSEMLQDDIGWDLLCALQQQAQSAYADLRRRVLSTRAV